MIIAVGTLNPAKIKAAQSVFRRIYPQAQVVGISVASGVSNQPWSDDETITGALNRARAALHHTNAVLGVGIEGGLSQNPHGLFTSEWCAIVNRKGKTGLGGGGNLLVPPVVAELLLQGYELGSIMDYLTGLKDVRKGLGTIGVLTRGLIDRGACYETIITHAITRFLSNSIYGSGFSLLPPPDNNSPLP